MHDENLKLTDLTELHNSDP